MRSQESKSRYSDVSRLFPVACLMEVQSFSFCLEINCLILQVCNYYEQIDSEHWVSPLLTALRENEQIPVSTSEGTTFLDPADETKMTNYECIDYMLNFGVTKIGFMDHIWRLSEESAKTTKSHVDMKATMEAIRGTVTGTKKSKL